MLLQARIGVGAGHGQRSSLGNRDIEPITAKQVFDIPRHFLATRGGHRDENRLRFQSLKFVDSADAGVSK